MRFDFFKLFVYVAVLAGCVLFWIAVIKAFLTFARVFQ